MVFILGRKVFIVWGENRLLIRIIKFILGFVGGFGVKVCLV